MNADALNARLDALGLLPLDAEQVALLTDLDEREQRRAMLEDLRDRCGVPLTDAEFSDAMK